MEKEEENNVYIVQEGDTIPSVSLKFDVSVGWIKEINGIDDNFIFPGQKLIVKSQSQLESTCLVDNVKIFGHEEPGKLFIKNACLSFIPKSDRKQPKIIDLRGHIESAILPHPNTIASGWVEDPLAPELPCLYIITWMNDIEKSSSIETMCFEGVFSEMNKISKLTTLQAEEIQRKMHIEIKQPEPEPIIRHPIEKMQPGSAPTMHLLMQPQPRQQVQNQSQMHMQIPQPVRKRRGMKPVKFIGETKILNEEDIVAIRGALPYSHRNATWKLLYQLSQHGSSYLTFFERCANNSPVLLVIRSNNGDRLGAYVSRGFKLSRNFYGSGEMFVFTCLPTFKVYRWRNNNQYFISSSKEEISVGGGGAAAIWIDGDFLNAFSESCPTFESPPLAKESHFKIIDVEVWLLSELL